jgi:hypothetical protein
VAAVVELPVPSARPRSDEVVSVGFVAAANFVSRAPAPTSVNIALAQGPTNHEEVGRPDQGAI